MRRRLVARSTALDRAAGGARCGWRWSHWGGRGGADAAAEHTVVVRQCDLVAEQWAVAPSVTAEPLLDYAGIHTKFSRKINLI